MGGTDQGHEATVSAQVVEILEALPSAVQRPRNDSSLGTWSEHSVTKKIVDCGEDLGSDCSTHDDYVDYAVVSTPSDAVIEDLVSAELPSIGSAGHHNNTCKPCAFVG